MKNLLFALMLISSNLVIAQKESVILGGITVGPSIPCPIDTIKGVLIWHSKEPFNEGNTWDTAYWVGKCGPIGINTESVNFIPGVLKTTRGTCKDLKCKVIQYYEEEYLNEGFRDRDFKRIPARQVYGLIIIHK